MREFVFKRTSWRSPLNSWVAHWREAAARLAA
jgi:hypothetical protein